MPWKRKYVPDVANSKSFLNSSLVMFKPRLCSNNKLTAILKPLPMFLGNDKTPYPFTYILSLGSI